MERHAVGPDHCVCTTQPDASHIPAQHRWPVDLNTLKKSDWPVWSARYEEPIWVADHLRELSPIDLRTYTRYYHYRAQGHVTAFWESMYIPTPDNPDPALHLWCLEAHGLAYRHRAAHFSMNRGTSLSDLKLAIDPEETRPNCFYASIIPRDSHLASEMLRIAVQGWERAWDKRADTTTVLWLADLLCTGGELGGAFHPDELVESARLASLLQPEDPQPYTIGVLRKRRRRHQEIKPLPRRPTLAALPNQRPIHNSQRPPQPPQLRSPRPAQSLQRQPPTIITDTPPDIIDGLYGPIPVPDHPSNLCPRLRLNGERCHRSLMAGLSTCYSHASKEEWAQFKASQ